MDNDTPNEESPPKDCKVYNDLKELKDDYEIEASDAVKMILCNFTALNMAIECGFAKQLKQKPPQLSAEDIAAVSSHICCDFHIHMDSNLDKLKRIKIQGMFTDLMVYDLEGVKGEVSALDFASCLEEFMMENYMTEPDEQDVDQICKILLQIRKEYLD